MKAFEVTNKAGKIGPHEGEVVERMRDGSKPIGILMFPNERNEIEALLQDVENGTLKVLKKPNTYFCETDKNWESHYFFFQLDQEENVKQLNTAIASRPSSQEEYIERNTKIGQLLGYTANDIDLFFKWPKSTLYKTLVTISNTPGYNTIANIFRRTADLDYTPIAIEEKLQIPTIEPEQPN